MSKDFGQNFAFESSGGGGQPYIRWASGRGITFYALQCQGRNKITIPIPPSVPTYDKDTVSGHKSGHITYFFSQPWEIGKSASESQVSIGNDLVPFASSFV